MQGAAVGDRQPGEEGLCARANAMFHPAFFLPLADMARGHGQAAVVGTVARRGSAHRRFAHGALEDGGCASIDQDVVGDAAKTRTGLVMAGQPVLHGLGDGARDIHPPAGAQDHDKEAQLAAGVPYRDGPQGAPSTLGARARGTGQCEQGGLPAGSDRAHRGFDACRAAVKATFAPALEDWGGRRGRALHQADTLRCERIPCAGALAGLARPEVFLGKPVGHRTRIARQGLGDLRRVEPVVGMEGCALAQTGVVDPDNTSQSGWTTALRSTGSSSSAGAMAKR